MRHSLTTLSIAMIASLSFLAAWSFQKLSLQLGNHTQANYYDSFSDQLVQTQFAKNGEKSSTFSAPSSRHYPAGNYILFNQPHILIYNQSAPWIVDAPYGKNFEDNDVFYLFNHVVAVQPAIKELPKTVIVTDHATVYSKTSFLTTDAPVTIDRGGTHVQGVGATADFKKGIIKILKNTQGYYAEPKN